MKKVLLVLAGIVGVAVVGLTVAVFVLAGRLESKLAAPQTPYPEVTASADPAVIARGEYVVRTVGHCSQCHGAYKRNEPAGNTAEVALSGGFEFTMGPMGSLYSANLTPDQETGIGRYNDKELARVLTTGVLPNGQLSVFMRYAASNLSDDDVAAVVSYLRSQPPVKNPVPPYALTTMGKAMFSLMTFTPDLSPSPKYVAAAEEPSVERGAYLAENVALCVTCHSKVDMATFLPTGPKAGGGDPDPSPGDDVDKVFVPPNLTSHATGMTGMWEEDAFVSRLRTGRVFVASKMPWENLSRMSESDLRSIYRYLKSLPPVDNDVGPTYRDKNWEPGS